MSLDEFEEYYDWELQLLKWHEIERIYEYFISVPTGEFDISTAIDLLKRNII